MVMNSQVPGGEQAGAGDGWPVRCGLVPPLAAGFIPRPETALRLAALAPGGTGVLVPAQSLASGGPDWTGSCGKTGLAVSFAESLWQAGEADLLVWISATSRAAVLSGYAQVTRVLAGGSPAGDADSLAIRFQRWLSSTSRRWLVVFDDLTHAGDLAGLWPAGPAGRVLITTANEGSLPPGRETTRLPVGLLSPREALSYLMGRLTSDPDQRMGAIDLVEDLACEPLALAQASAVIAHSPLSCRDYRERFLRARDELGGAVNSALPAASVTWQLSAQQAGRASAGGAARYLLALTALLGGHGIPGPVFTTNAVCGFLGEAIGSPIDPHGAWAVLGALDRAGLVSVDPPAAGTLRAVRVNRAVQAAVRDSLAPGLLERAARAAAEAVLEAWPPEHPLSWQADGLRSCVVSLQQSAGELLWSDGCHPLLQHAAQSLDSARLSGPAVSFWEEITTTSIRLAGEEHPDTVLAAERLAEACLAAGRLADAVSWSERVLADRVRTFGPDKPDTATARVRLGHALVVAGRPAEAVPVLTEAVTDCGRVLGPDDLDTLAAHEELAGAYRGAGRLPESIVLYRQTLASRERIQGARHPDTLVTRHQLAGAYLLAGRAKDAMSHFKTVLSQRQKLLGADHPDTIAARGSLASACHAAGRMASAVALLEEARADSERVLGAAHRDTLVQCANLAHAYYAVGRLGDARELLKTSLERCEQALPADDPLAQTLRQSMANIAGPG
jgi:tetratricopeptide (TPR) repeat protein